MTDPDWSPSPWRLLVRTVRMLEAGRPCPGWTRQLTSLFGPQRHEMLAATQVLVVAINSGPLGRQPRAPCQTGLTSRELLMLDLVAAARDSDPLAARLSEDLAGPAATIALAAARHLAALIPDPVVPEGWSERAA